MFSFTDPRDDGENQVLPGFVLAPLGPMEYDDRRQTLYSIQIHSYST